MAEENQEEINGNEPAAEPTPAASEVKAEAATGNGSADADSKKRPHRSQKVGVITSDKMEKTVVVRVDRLVRHTKYRRYVRRTSKFMAHDEMGATIGDKVKIVETRPMSARKRWRVIEIVQKAAK
jgi:small subunit ribosomal protein S17